jgi:hypothetical protein
MGHSSGSRNALLGIILSRFFTIFNCLLQLLRRLRLSFLFLLDRCSNLPSTRK